MQTFQTDLDPSGGGGRDFDPFGGGGGGGGGRVRPLIFWEGKGWKPPFVPTPASAAVAATPVPKLMRFSPMRCKVYRQYK